MLRHVYVISLLVLLAACGTSPKTDFYILNSQQDVAAPVASGHEKLAIGVWTVKLPDLLDRSEIVTRNSQFEIELADFSWWITDLEKNMTQLIATEIGRRLYSDDVVASPWESYRKNNYQVKILIDRFDGFLGGEVVLSGVWRLLDASGKKSLSTEMFRFNVNATDKSYKTMVVELSKLTVQLAEQVTNSIVVSESNKK